MRRQDIEALNQPYSGDGGAGERFASAVGADVPSARALTKEILSDLDVTTFGLPTLSSLPDQERILVSDYLYQCVASIQDNLTEAKIHFMEWQDCSDKQNAWLADIISVESGRPEAKMPKVTRPIEDFPNVAEKLHICGFFRAIGSSIDCLGGAITGILGLPLDLRRADLASAQRSLGALSDDNSFGRKMQIEYRKFLSDSINTLGPVDWLIWSTQYRNMFVHRGRRLFVAHFEAKDVQLLDGKGQPYNRAQTVGHLAKYPDKSDVEAFLRGGPTVLDEGIETTLLGVFNSTREFLEMNCEELLRIWQKRKLNHSLIEQPATQWKRRDKPCLFEGYDSTVEPLAIDALLAHGTTGKRLRAASTMDHQRQLWANSDWLD